MRDHGQLGFPICRTGNVTAFSAREPVSPPCFSDFTRRASLTTHLSWHSLFPYPAFFFSTALLTTWRPMYLFVSHLSPLPEFNLRRAESLFCFVCCSPPGVQERFWHLLGAVKWVSCRMNHEIVVKKKKIHVKCSTWCLAHRRASIQISCLSTPHRDYKMKTDFMILPPLPFLLDLFTLFSKVQQGLPQH